MSEVEELLAPEEIATRLNVSRRSVYRWLREGDLPALKLGRTWRVRWSEVLALIRRQDADAD